jgi:3'-phosphoadenosine 5'-phosphosulfate sulfotransferase (PAPS reductase)/FAD synthetase
MSTWKKSEDKIYIASWSGGKDSTFMVDELLRRSEPLDEVVFCDTGFEFPQMYDYIEMCKAYWEKKYSVKITLLNWKTDHTIPNYMIGKVTRGENEGRMRGFPNPINVGWCTARFKIDPTKTYWKKQYSGFDVYEYIGIAADEPKRIPPNWENGTKIYPLVVWGIKESDVNPVLKERGMFNPLYNHYTRTGCWACPKQGIKDLAILKENYPDLWLKLEEMEKPFTKENTANYVNENGEENAKPYLFKGIGIEVLNQKVDLINSNKGFDFDDMEEPVGCFCK